MGRYTLAFALVLVGCGSTPEGDLKNFGDAVRRGDSADAVRYLDIDRTTSTLVNEIVTLTLKRSTGPNAGEASKLGGEMGEAMIRMMQPAVEAMIKQGVYDVVSGRPIHVPASLAKGGLDTVSRDSVLQLSPRILGSRKFDDSAFVQVEIHPRDKSAAETLQVKMEHPGKVWRVVRLDGVESLVDSLAQRRR
jgi:hypothetical protein